MEVSLSGTMLLSLSVRVFGLTSLVLGEVERIDGCVEQFARVEGSVDEEA